MSTVLDMLRQTISESRTKIASLDLTGSQEKTASSQAAKPKSLVKDWEKVASACGEMASRLEQDSAGSTHEKIAELLALAEKAASVMSDEPQGPHQTSASSDDPGTAATPPVVTPAMTAGESLNANQSGSASDQPPAGGEEPKDTIDQPPGGNAVIPEKLAQVKLALIQGLHRRGVLDTATAQAMTKAASLGEVAGRSVAALASSGNPTVAAKRALLAAASGRGKESEKTAADSGATITAGTVPELQSVAPPGQSQGSETGQATPEGPADGKRSFVQSIAAAINAKKSDLKDPNDGMSQWLDQRMGPQNDNVLQTQLDNTSEAGTKMASIRALLEKWASEDPSNKAKLDAAVFQVKQSNAMMGYGADASMGQGGGMDAPAPKTAEMGEPEEVLDEAALEAAAAGVTPESLAQAMAMLEGAAAEGQPPLPGEMTELQEEEGL